MQAYGIVWRAIDKKTRETVALKKIFDAFQNATDAQVGFSSELPCLTDRSLTELKHNCSNFSPLRQRAFSLPIYLLIFLQRTFREIMFLQELDNHENIIK